MQTRNTLMRTVYVGIKELGLNNDDTAWRAKLKKITGHDSLKSCSYKDLQNIIDSLKKDGFKIKSNKSKPMTRTGAHYKDPRDKALSLWIKLADYGAVRDSSDNALAKYCAKIAKIDHWHWLDSVACYSVIESLKSWLGRVELNRFMVALYKSGKVQEMHTTDHILLIADRMPRLRKASTKTVSNMSYAQSMYVIDYVAAQFKINNVQVFIKEVNDGD